MYPFDTTFPYTFTFPVDAIKFDVTRLLVLMYVIVSVLKFMSTVVVLAKKVLSTWSMFAA
jgi:hypothetical protein